MEENMGKIQPSEEFEEALGQLAAVLLLAGHPRAIESMLYSAVTLEIMVTHYLDQRDSCPTCAGLSSCPFIKAWELLPADMKVKAENAYQLDRKADQARMMAGRVN